MADVIAPSFTKATYLTPTNMSKETYIKQKRLMERDLHYKNVKRDLHKAKETHGERPTSQKYIQTYT